MDNNDIEFEIRRMILEMISGYNDGWVQDSYRKKLKSIQKLVNGALDE
jgi:hypothetical protein